MIQPRILFVDDEPNILAALKRFTRAKRGVWEMDFVAGGAEAMAALRSGGYNVVVSDMRMPDVSGATLLEWISRHMPGVVRIVLSGEANLAETYRIVGKSHRFLAKPCDAETLLDTIETSVSACGSQSCYSDGPNASFLDRLTTPRATLERAADMAGRGDVDGLTDLVRSDPSLAARLMQLVNSAYFGRPVATFSIGRAVHAIGAERIADLLANGRLGGSGKGEDCTPRKPHPLELAGMAHALVAPSGRDLAELAYTAGLFVHLGRASGPMPIGDDGPWCCAPYAAGLLGFPAELKTLLARLAAAAAPALDAQGAAELVARLVCHDGEGG